MLMEVYPNPFCDQINLEFKGISTEVIVDIIITDLQGKIVFKRSTIVRNGQIELDNLSLNVGSYLVKVAIGKEILTKQIMKFN